MSATILSKIVELDELTPMLGNVEQEDRDVESLIPWIFRHATTADEFNVLDWPENDYMFSSLFDDLPSYCAELENWQMSEGEQCAHTGVTNALKERETITLPKRSWDVSEKQRFGHFIGSQGMMLRALMKTIYINLDGLRRGDLEIHFTASRFKLKYVIGGEQFRTRLEGAVTIGPLTERLPILSYTGWFEGQTWSEFLGETVGAMLGQLAANLSIRNDDRSPKDHEVFVIGFHGLHLHIARGLFAANSISRVQREGCSKDDIFDLSFTRGYNLCLKKDWLEATRALTRLLRYLISGNANVSAIQAFLSTKPNTES